MQTIHNHRLSQLNAAKNVDQSLYSLRFNRTAREAGWTDAPIDDEGPTGAAVVWGLGALVVAIVVLALWLAK